MNCLTRIANTKLYTFPFLPISSNMYILISDDEALIIDPCKNMMALQLIKENGVKKVLIFLTHEHYDHISGINWLKENIDCKVFAQKLCANNIKDIKKNLSNHFGVLMQIVYEVESEVTFSPYICEADVEYENYYELEWKGHIIEIIHTPGHSEGSVCIFIDEDNVFVGDSLIKKKVITKLPGGSKKSYNEITLPFLKSLPNNTMVFPGHGEPDILKNFLKLV